jgi:HSP20 family protein
MFSLTPWKREDRGGALTRRSEFPLNRLRDEFDNLFERFFGNWPAPFEMGWSQSRWNFGVEDTDKEVVVRAEAPGFEPQDFDVQVSGNWLTIQAEHKDEKETKEGEGPYSERSYRRFQRSFSLPVGTETNNVEARYRNGVLEVRLPKKPEAQGKRIEVKS